MTGGLETLCHIRELHRAISEFEQQFQSRHGLCMNEGMLLCTLKKSCCLTSGAIADALTLSVSNASKVISAAEKKGLVSRSLGDCDKRQMRFMLTDKGEKVLEEISKCELHLPPPLAALMP